MSDDQHNPWNTPKPSPPIDPWGQTEGELPKPGESWGDAHAPKPIHQVDEDWGQAPMDGSVNAPPHQQPYRQGPPQQPQQPYGAPQQPHGAPQRPGQPNQQLIYQGYPNQAMTTSTSLDTNDIIAIVVTCFFPGIGHLMVGQTSKGIAIFAAMILTCGIAAIAWPIVMIDLIMVAQARKRRPLADWECFPK